MDTITMYRNLEKLLQEYEEKRNQYDEILYVSKDLHDNRDRIVAKIARIRNRPYIVRIFNSHKGIKNLDEELISCDFAIQDRSENLYNITQDIKTIYESIKHYLYVVKKDNPDIEEILTMYKLLEEREHVIDIDILVPVEKKMDSLFPNLADTVKQGHHLYRYLTKELKKRRLLD